MSAPQISPSEVPITLQLNGGAVSLSVPPSEILIDTIRDRLGLLGTNLGCDHASCGACTVVIDGSPQASCSTFSWVADTRQVTTIEGVGDVDDLCAVQQAFAATSAFQCGYCTPGLIMTTTALLAEIPNPDEATIREWISSNICRCTGYKMVIEAVQRAAEHLQGQSS